MSPPKLPIRHLAGAAEAALEAAKGNPGKNAASLWQRTLPWSAWNELLNERRAALEALMARAGQEGAEFSTGLTYCLLQLSDRAESRRPEDAVWRSQLHYRLTRYFRDRVKGDPSASGRRQSLLAEALAEIGGALSRHKGAYRIPLSVLLYRQRE